MKPTLAWLTVGVPVTMNVEDAVEDATELLTGMSDSELEALAEGALAPANQARLDALLDRQADQALSAAERGELDRLLAQIDQLTILKTRARYTLHRRAVAGPT